MDSAHRAGELLLEHPGIHAFENGLQLRLQFRDPLPDLVVLPLPRNGALDRRQLLVQPLERRAEPAVLVGQLRRADRHGPVVLVEVGQGVQHLRLRLGQTVFDSAHRVGGRAVEPAHPLVHAFENGLQLRLQIRNPLLDPVALPLPRNGALDRGQLLVQPQSG